MLNVKEEKKWLSKIFSGDVHSVTVQGGRERERGGAEKEAATKIVTVRI